MIVMMVGPSRNIICGITESHRDQSISQYTWSVEIVGNIVMPYQQFKARDCANVILALSET